MFDTLLGTARAADLLTAERWGEWLLRLGVALLIAGAGWWLSKRLAGALVRLLERLGVEPILRGFLAGLANAIGLIVVLVAALDALGVPTTSLLAVLGAAGLAIGLALKDSLSNIASGVMLIVLRPFRAGDSVSIAGQEGTVEHVRIFQTRLRTAQGHEVILPNSQITTAPIVNYTARPQRRIDITLNIGYDQDLAQVRRLLLAIAGDEPRVLATPAPEVSIGTLGEAAVGVSLNAWVPTPDYGGARNALLMAIRERFAREAIPLALPRREIAVLPPAAPAD